eukprot:UN10852
MQRFTCAALLGNILGSLRFSVTGLSPSLARLSCRFT